MDCDTVGENKDLRSEAPGRSRKQLSTTSLTGHNLADMQSILFENTHDPRRGVTESSLCYVQSDPSVLPVIQELINYGSSRIDGS